MKFLTRVGVIFASTVFLGLWLGLIAKQQHPIILLASHAVFFAALVGSVCPLLLRARRLPVQVLTGALAGFLASLFSLAVVVLLIYGPDQFRSRYLTQHFYFYPMVSLGWLHGAIVTAALCWQRAISDRR